MKKELPKGALFGVIAVGVLLLGFVIFRAMSQPNNDAPSAQDMSRATDAAMEFEKKREAEAQQAAKSIMDGKAAPESASGEAAARGAGR